MKKVQRISVCALSLVLVLALAACGAGGIVGKWAFGVNTYEFKEDNTVSISLNGVLNYDGTYEVSGDTVKLTVKGLVGEQTKELAFKRKGNTLSLTGDVTLSGVSTTIEFTKQ